jgi:Zn-dependent protease with chaperone function
MIDRLAEVVLQTFIAAFAVELLLRLWQVSCPSLKIRMRLLVLLVPLVFHPALQVLAPFRAGEGFAERWALFSSQRWAAVELLGVAADRVWLLGCALIGLVLLFADLVPWGRRLLVGRGRHLPTAPVPDALLGQVARLSGGLGIPVPRVVFLDSPALLLCCRGIRVPALVVSQGAVASLDDEELEAALAHELSHLQSADVLMSWGLLVARLLHAFNPAVHVIARGMARDQERRADLAASTITGQPLALASALIKVFRASRTPRRGQGRARAFLERAREAEIEDRCRRLLRPAASGTQSFPRLRLWSTAVGLLTLLFFVT